MRTRQSVSLYCVRELNNPLCSMSLIERNDVCSQYVWFNESRYESDLQFEKNEYMNYIKLIGARSDDDKTT